jgi:hypothetical protein
MATVRSRFTEPMLLQLVAMRHPQFFLSSIRKTLEQDRLYRVVPKAIDERLVCEYRIRLYNGRA